MAGRGEVQQTLLDEISALATASRESADRGSATDAEHNAAAAKHLAEAYAWLQSQSQPH